MQNINSTSKANLIKLGYKSSSAKIIHQGYKNYNKAQIYKFDRPAEEFGEFKTQIEYGEELKSKYCSGNLYPENIPALQQLILEQENLKKKLSNFSSEELQQRRFKTSPFDALPLNIYNTRLINKAAWKLIEINHLTDNIFFKTEDKKFADICCAPGGFTHTITMKNIMRTDAFLITLGDIQIHKSLQYNMPDRKINIMYGDITNKTIQMNFVDLCGYQELDFAMADGGFNFKNIEDEQEFKCRRLTLSQIYLALVTVKNGGFFLLKLFNVYSKFTQSLLFAVLSCFDEMLIIKPLSSRPANSEKYFLFKTYTLNISIIKTLEHLMSMCGDELSHVDEICFPSSEFKVQLNEALVAITQSQIASLKLFIESDTTTSVEYNTDDILRAVFDNSRASEKLRMSMVLANARRWNNT